MKIINEQLLNQLTAQAKESPRLRMNYNFHEELDDPLNRLLNAMEPDTYIRPHRHLSPPKEEIFQVLRGKIYLFIFDGEGTIINKLMMSPEEGVYGAELPAGTWHSLIVLEPGTVLYEIKPGPFTPLPPEDLAPWSPPQENTEEVENFLVFLRSNID